MNNFDDIFNNTPQEQKPQEQYQRVSNEEYAQQKQAEREALYKTSDDAALRIANNGIDFQKFLDAQARLNYSAVNTLLVMEVKPEATQLGDFNYWKDRDCSIIKDEKGIAILEPNEYTKDDGSVGIGYNVKKVFDISQVDTQNLKTELQPNFDNRQILKALVHNAPMTIRGVDELPDGGGAMTDPQTGDILVLKDMAFNDAFRSVAHEMALAEVDHEKVKDPQFTAYCASYILCKKHGVDTKDYNFDSVPIMFKDMDAREVKSELSQVRSAADEISGRMARQLDSIQKAERSQEAR